MRLTKMFFEMKIYTWKRKVVITITNGWLLIGPEGFFFEPFYVSANWYSSSKFWDSYWDVTLVLFNFRINIRKNIEEYGEEV